MPRDFKEEPEEKFKESSDLKALTKEILAAKTPELQDARKWKYSIIFTTKKLTRHRAAYCRKMDGPVGFKTKLDFIIVIEYESFMKVKPMDKVQRIIHELHHIETGPKNGEPKLREHDEDFCEIHSHDKFSREIAQRIVDNLPTLSKIPYQTTLEEQNTNSRLA